MAVPNNKDIRSRIQKLNSFSHGCVSILRTVLRLRVPQRKCRICVSDITRCSILLLGSCPKTRAVYVVDQLIMYPMNNVCHSKQEKSLEASRKIIVTLVS